MRAAPTARHYAVRAESTETFGRIRCEVRANTFEADGPVGNGCPGERPTPGELLLAAAGACGAELIQVLARDQHVPLQRVQAEVQGTIDRDAQPHAHVTVFNRVHLHFTLAGPSEPQAQVLVAAFQQRCPVYGSLAVASVEAVVTHAVV